MNNYKIISIFRYIINLWNQPLAEIKNFMIVKKINV